MEHALRARRRAAPKPGPIPSGDRLRYSAGEGHTVQARRRAAPKPGPIPSGDRLRYSAGEGHNT